MTLEPFDPRAVTWPEAPGLLPAIVQDRADGRVLMLAWVDREALDAMLATGDVHFHSRSRDRLWRKGETSGNVLRLNSIAVDCDGDALLLTVDPAGPTCHRGTRSCFDLDGAAPAVPTGANAAPVSAPVSASGAASVGARGASAAPVAATVTASAASAAPVSATPAVRPQGFAWLETLWATIADRVAQRPAGSYTTSLLDAGVDAAARKVTEEATEVLIAAKDDAVAESAGSSRTESRQALASETADLLFHVLVLLAERGIEPSEVVDVLQGRHAPAS